MRKSIPAALLAVIFIFTAVASAQNRTLPEEEWYGDVKSALASHYTGKTVRAKQMFPATRNGLEIVDGALQNSSGPNPPPALAQPGDELVIKSFKVGDTEIDILLAKNEPPPKKRFTDVFTVQKQPRIHIRFNRELTSKDMTIESVNRALAAVIDVTSLAPPVVEKSPTATQASLASPQNDASAKSSEVVNDKNLPTPDIVGDLPSLTPNVGELTIESMGKQARVYIDGAYSGIAPRTVRLRAGARTILVVSDGHAPWEQRLFIPGGKISVVRADLQRAMR